MDTLYSVISLNSYSIIFIVLGILIRYLIGRRRFNRRGIGGLQHFSSYGMAVVISLIEWLFRWAANVLIIAGIFMLIKW